ncbi:MAG TPA: palindromic element RPE4 domain-containing protein, partial [Rickettsia endosymbiont of Pyrocoelia pectoralis]|nr:palindromic element RPE4 domain-containing protein [Rickettsia endosymbiont of Pyrocoelia pectoralis]
SHATTPIYSRDDRGTNEPCNNADLFTGSSKTYKKFSFVYVYFIKYFFLDTVVKPRYDTEGVFGAMQPNSTQMAIYVNSN